MASNETENQFSCNSNEPNDSLSNSCAETSVVIEPQDLKINTKLKLFINKFCEIGNDHILSPIFNIGLNTKWYFKIKTNHTNGNKDVEYLSIHLFLCYCEELSVRAKYSVSIVDVNNELKNTKTCDQLEYKISGDGWGYHKFCDKKYLIDRFSELLPNNRLTLLCDIQVFGEQNSCIEDNFLVEFKKIRSSFKMLSDFTFIVSGKEFAAHKTILAVRSPVFAAMFNNNHKKSSGKECIDKLVISDIESNVFRELLSFIYTGKSTELPNMAQKLLPLSQNYNIIQLKSICEDVLYDDLRQTNAIKTIILALNCKANKLRDRVIDYIADNLLLVRNESPPEEWKHFIQEYPTAVDKVFEAISYKTQKNTNKKQFHINRWIFRKFKKK